MIIGPYIKPEKPKARRQQPKGKVRLAAEKHNLTVKQIQGRMRTHGLTVEEAVAYRPLTPAESGSLGGKAKARRRRNG